jgi:hypothetical protein
MATEKKQKINNTGLFIVLSFTILLPLNLFSIVYSSLLDSPFIPILGIPLYYPGFPRSKRFWVHVNSVIKRTGESMLYK